MKRKRNKNFPSVQQSSFKSFIDVIFERKCWKGLKIHNKMDNVQREEHTGGQLTEITKNDIAEEDVSKWDKFLDKISDGSRKTSVLIRLPYFVAILWILIHPLVSVATGELKCRGMYIDESSFLLHNARSKYFEFKDFIFHENASPSVEPQLDQDFECDRFRRISARGMGGSTSCSTMSDFMLIGVHPRSTHSASDAHEVILFVFDHYVDDSSEHVRQMISALIHRLTSSGVWMSRTVLFAMPTTKEMNASGLVESLLQLYVQGDLSTLSRMPISGMIRQAFVIDFRISKREDGSGGSEDSFSNSELECTFLIPGRNGLLPNMDFVAASFESLRPLLKKGKNKEHSLHPFKQLFLFSDKITRNFPKKSTTTMYVKDLLGMVGFIASSAIGIVGDHAPFLEYGIDSMTVIVEVPINNERKFRDDIQTFATACENLIRGFSNLHERLHHSVALYILPSTKKFISNAEFILPCIVALLPCLLNFLKVVFRESKHLDSSVFLPFVLCSFASSTGTVLAMVFTQIDWLYNVQYLAVVCLLYRNKALRDSDRRKIVLALAQVLIIYVHVPMLLWHYSLALPSILMWVFTFSVIPSDATCWAKYVKGLILFLTYPPFFLVPFITGEYNMYIWMIHNTFHLLCSALLISSDP